MKLRLFKTSAIAGALAIAGAALPASASESLRVKVPFAFVLAGQEFSAGQYRVSQNDNGLVIVQGEGRAAAVLTVPADDAKRPEPSALRFTTNDSREYLVGVQVEGERGRTIPLTGYQEHKLTVATR